MGSPLADLPPPQVDAEQVRRVVEEVLSRPEYREAAPTLRDRILAFLGDQWGRLMDLLAGSRQGSLIASLVILAAVGLVAFLGVRFARGLRRDPEVAAAVGGPVGRRADDWRADAQEHERAGRWREALRCHYRALIADLAAAGVIDEVPGATSGEYLAASAEALPVAAEPMAWATESFELAWYGNRPVDESQVAALRAAAERVLAVRGRPAPVGAGAP